MSTSQPTSLAPSDGQATDSIGSDRAEMPGIGAVEHDATLGAADIASLLAASQSGVWGQGDDAGAPGSQAYEGHVALALDPGTMADIDLTLDLLTTSHQLFDVPVLDVNVSDDVSPA